MTAGRDLQARLLETFVVESGDRLRTIERGLLAIEADSDGDSAATVGELFREAHSLKGAAQVVGQLEIAEAAHTMEAALADLRRTGTVPADDLRALFDVSGRIAALLRGPTGSAKASPEHVADTVAAPRTARAATPGTGPRRARHTKASSEATLWQTGTAESPPATTPSDIEAGARATGRVRAGTVRVATDRLDDVLTRVPDLLAARRRQAERHRKISAFRLVLAEHGREWRDVARRLKDHGDATTNATVLEDLGQLATRVGGEITQLERVADRLAVESRRDRDRLMALADGLGTDLLSLRLVPVELFFDSFPRMVRDLAAASDKRVRLRQIGWQTEVDREVLERVKDSVMHLLRNAIDHGIEPEAERVAAGKSPIGTIVVEASQRDGGIAIEVRDDGRGVDPRAVVRAVAKAGTPQGDLPEPDDLDAILALLLRPGVSTARSITDVSGRGVGLDVVSEQVSQLGGRVRIATEPGQGTTVSLRLPLTLIMAHVLMVRGGDRTFGLPVGAVQRCLRLTPDLITDVAGQPALRLVDGTVPIVDLDEVVGLTRSAGRRTATPYVAIVNDARRLVGLVVDEVIDERHVVVNGLGSLLPIPAAGRLVAGATLVNEDEVVLILDAPAIAARALSAARSGRPENAVGGNAGGTSGSFALEASHADAKRSVSVLVVDDSITTRTLEQSILTAAGFRVATAEDGARGLAAARREPPDVIVADVEMPSLDGVEMTRRLKGDPATRDIPIILLTALETAEQLAAGLEAGADAYLLKSGFDQERLIAAIRGLVG
jgi:two-component system chemotaxis sensor kinase CheA